MHKSCCGDTDRTLDMPTLKRALRVVVYSSNGSANYDVRIQSQATFLKSQGLSVTLVEPIFAISEATFDWKSSGIDYVCGNSATALRLLEEAVSLLVETQACLERRLARTLLLRPAVVLLRQLAKGLRRALRRSVLRKLRAVRPDVIITRDIIPKEVMWHKRRFPHTIILSDLHEVVFWQQDAINTYLRSKQLAGFKTITGAICVTEQIRAAFYPDIGKPVLVIPNVPSSSLCDGIPFESRARNKETVFLIHGGYTPSRDHLVDKILEAWEGTPENAILCVRILNENAIRHLVRRYGKMPRIRFLPPVHGGFREELKETAGQFDIGILPIPAKLSPMYDMCSPNRLALYLHAGMGIVYPPSSYVDQIAERANAGVRWVAGDDSGLIDIVQSLSNDRGRVEVYRSNAFEFAKSSYQYECFGKGLVDLITSSVEKTTDSVLQNSGCGEH